MTTIKKHYLPPTAEEVSLDSVQPLLAGSNLDVIIEDDNVDIVDQDAPGLILGTTDMDEFLN